MKNTKTLCKLISLFVVTSLVTIVACFALLGIKTEQGETVMSFSAEQLSFTSAMASSTSDNTKTITASVYPTSATSRLQWSIAWKNPNSTWASGKNISDYLAVNVSSTKSTATVVCRQAFGEQAIVTAKCDDLSKTVTVDYTERLLSFTIWLRASNDTYVTISLAEGASDMTLKYGGNYPFYSGVDYDGDSTESFTDGTIMDRDFELIFSKRNGTVKISDIRQMSASDIDFEGCSDFNLGVRYGSKTYWLYEVENY